MARRRMFSKEITESDAFLSMPLSTQALYFHYGMNADDYGVINSPKRIMRFVGAAEDDYKILVAKKFIIEFEDEGVIVVKHWRLNNYLQKDHIIPTNYPEVIARLAIDRKKAYTTDFSKMDKKCIQNGRVDKNSEDKSSIEEISLVESSIEVEKGYKGKEVTYEDIRRKCEEARKRRYGE